MTPPLPRRSFGAHPCERRVFHGTARFDGVTRTRVERCDSSAAERLKRTDELYGLIVTGNPLQPTAQPFAGVARDVRAHAKTQNVNVVGGLRRAIGQHRYQLGHIVSDRLAPQSGGEVRQIRREPSPVHTHHVVIGHDKIF